MNEKKIKIPAPDFKDLDKKGKKVYENLTRYLIYNDSYLPHLNLYICGVSSLVDGYHVLWDLKTSLNSWSKKRQKTFLVQQNSSIEDLENKINTIAEQINIQCKVLGVTQNERLELGIPLPTKFEFKFGSQQVN